MRKENCIFVALWNIKWLKIEKKELFSKIFSYFTTRALPGGRGCFTLPICTPGEIKGVTQ